MKKTLLLVLSCITALGGSGAYAATVAMSGSGYSQDVQSQMLTHQLVSNIAGQDNEAFVRKHCQDVLNILITRITKQDYSARVGSALLIHLLGLGDTWNEVYDTAKKLLFKDAEKQSGEPKVSLELAGLLVHFLHKDIAKLDDCLELFNPEYSGNGIVMILRGELALQTKPHAAQATLEQLSAYKGWISHKDLFYIWVAVRHFDLKRIMIDRADQYLNFADSDVPAP